MMLKLLTMGQNARPLSLPMDMPGKYLESVIYWQTRFKSGGSLLSVKVSRCSISLYYVGTVATVLR